MDERKCPICGKTYTDMPALSRLDNVTLICPDCGTRQALESLGCDDQEKENILQMVKAHEARKRFMLVK